MQAHRLPARRGALWLLGGLQLLRANPPLLTALTFGYFFLVLVLLLLPYVGQFLLPFMLPLMVLVMANGCRAIERGGLKSAADLVDGWRDNRVALLRLGGLQFLTSLVVLGLSTILNLEIDPNQPGQALPTLIGLLVISAPVLLAFWFAPMLTGWQGIPPLKSVFFSFVACLRNWRAVTIFVLTVVMAGVVLPAVLLMPATLISPALAKGMSYAVQVLLMVVLLPAVNAAVYLSYRDVFADE